MHLKVFPLLQDRTVEERVLRDFIDRKDAQNLRIDK